MYIPRLLNVHSVLEKKSLFLLGPRQTGKSALIRNTLNNIQTFDLLDSATFLKLNMNPSRLREEIAPHTRQVAIDEIQKLPQLLDEVHWLIEERKIRFLLTGSSARKLRRGGTNLLGGRARTRKLHPFVYTELKNFDLKRALNYGLLPSIYLSDSPREDIIAYCGDYLQQEIAAEGAAKNLPAFSRFLEVAALSQANLINFSQIASDAQVKLPAVREYFEILTSTLIAHELLAFKRTRKRKAIQVSKLYFFDIGVVRALQQRNSLNLKSPEFGEAFETYLFHELLSYIDYQREGVLNYWRSGSGYEVDFILNEELAIEVKAKENISSRELKGLLALKEEKKVRSFCVVCLEKEPRMVSGIRVLPWQRFLEMLWSGAMNRLI